MSLKSMNIKDKRIGFNTTLPLELIILAGYHPVDLNNLFITDSEAEALISDAERKGFPRNICAWIKGIYGAVLKNNLKTLIMVENGDCSNARALGEILEDEGVEIIPFSYPSISRTDKKIYEKAMKIEISRLAEALGLKDSCMNQAANLLDEMRAVLNKVDIANGTGRLSGVKTLELLLSGTDAGGGNPAEVIFKANETLKALDNIENKSINVQPRLAYVGIPPINCDIINFLEDELGAQVVYLELPRQFAVPGGIPSGLSLAERYSLFTYPGPFRMRFEDITKQLKERKVDGVIHYVQSFCFRAMEDKLLRNWSSMPVITIEGDKTGNIDARTRMRLENFVFMLNV